MVKWHPNPGLDPQMRPKLEAARYAMNANSNRIATVSIANIIEQAIAEWLERYAENPAAVKRTKE